MSLIDSLKTVLGSAWHVASDSFLSTLLPAVDGTAEAGKPITLDANLAINGVTIAELVRAADVSARLVTHTTSPQTVAPATHEGKTTVLSLATGIAVTLPAASGSGAKYKFVIGLANSAANGHTIATAPTTDIFQGYALVASDNGSGADFSWPCASDTNKITLGGTSQATGGSVGDTVEIEDIAAGVWACRVTARQGGTEATPFSHV